MTNNILEVLIQSENGVVALLAFLVMTLAGVIVYQWTHTMKNTVPKWAWDGLASKIDELLKTQEKTLIIINERLK